MIKIRQTHGFVELKADELEVNLFKGDDVNIIKYIDEFKDAITALEEYLEENDN